MLNSGLITIISDWHWLSRGGSADRLHSSDGRDGRRSGTIAEYTLFKGSMNTSEIYRAVDHIENSEPLLDTIRGYWSILVRRKWLVLACIVIGAAASAVVATTMPNSYRSTTLIMVEGPTVPAEYVKGIQGAGIGERVAMIQKQVMSRTSMAEIIKLTKVYGNISSSEEIDAAIDTMTKSVKVETVGTTGGLGTGIVAVTISFVHEDPMMARDVTAKLASHFIEQNTLRRDELVTGTTTFLEQELEDARATLERQEKAISRFKADKMGLLPEQLDTNLKSLDRLQTSLITTDEMLRSLSDRLGVIEKSIKDYKASGTTTSESGQTAVPAGLDPMLVRLRELEKKVISLRAGYTEMYPDIAETRREIEKVKAELAHKYGEPASKIGELGKTFDPYLGELTKQRDALHLEIETVKDRRQKIARQIQQLETRVEQSPAAEQELLILVRDYKNMQENYQSLLEKRRNAGAAAKLEKNKQGEQYRIVDPANIPHQPEKQKRWPIILLGVFGGCGIGFGLAVGLDHLTPTFKRREELESIPGVRLLAIIPNFHSIYSASTIVAPPLNLVSKWHPRSVASEQYRMAATKLAMAAEGRDSMVIVVTSALKGEGKTTTAVNLGYTLARDFGNSTLIIECDFGCPALYQYVDRPARYGLIDWLDGHAPLGDCQGAIGEVHCSVIDAGEPDAEVNEFRAIQQLRTMLPTVRANFKYIILNTAPVLCSATTGLLASMGDMVIVVVQAHCTPRDVVQKAFTMLGLAHEKQVVFNGADASSIPSYMYGYSIPYGKKQLAAYPGKQANELAPRDR